MESVGGGLALAKARRRLAGKIVFSDCEMV